ncbi:exonuclease domain-containing protein [uncultured Serinicoccus sp.]|uniref:exonuclease domain-containing protein n=1 Tax=uncultured Serinicoccus sp. TaxID=735514 RepID=UPI00260775A2|nr:exonuclease domain-containing protein [uncultured Serinicoccus sp.]
MGLRELLPGRRARPTPGTALADLAAASAVDPRTPLAQVQLLALDLETTGLDPRRHEVLSVGHVPVVHGRIVLARARHELVRPQGPVGESAVHHGLTDDRLAHRPDLALVLPGVLEALRTGDVEGAEDARPVRRVLLAHFAQIETAFLSAACRRLYGTDVPLQVVDTLTLAQRMLRVPTPELASGRLRLDACRRHYRLPRYRAHSALTDALACAELFLAQSAELAEQHGRALRLADVLAR